MSIKSMNRQEKICLLVEKLGVHGFKKSHAGYLNLTEIDQIIEFLAMTSFPVNERKRPPKPRSNNYLLQGDYRDALVEHIREVLGIELPNCVPVGLYESIVNCYESKQEQLTTTL